MRGEKEANLDLRPCFVPQCARPLAMTWMTACSLELFANMDQNFHAAVECQRRDRPVPGTAPGTGTHGRRPPGEASLQGDGDPTFHRSVRPVPK